MTAFNDEDFIAAAGFLGRRFLLNLDYFQRQFFYHQRYMHYLTDGPKGQDNMIVPTLFVQDLCQEASALLVIDRRVNALGDGTTTILDTVSSSLQYLSYLANATDRF